MGIRQSKKNNERITIDDYKKVTIPPEYKLIKLCTYNVNLKNTINFELQIKEIIEYIVSSYKNKTNDIVCLQGIYDDFILFNLVKDLKTYFIRSNNNIYISPNFDNIEADNDKKKFSSHKMQTISYEIKKTDSSSSSKISSPQNIIISRYPIVDIIYIELDDETDMDDVIGVQTLVGANININNAIISVYTTNLCKDIRSSNIKNDKVRNFELNTVFGAIMENKKILNSINYKPFTKTDIHLIVGTLNIPETVNMQINNEFTKFVQSRSCIDIYRYLADDDDLGYTTSYNERLDYILLSLTEDLYVESSPFYKKMRNIKKAEDLLNILHKRYSIHFIDSYVKNNTISNHHPVELIFMVKIIN